MIVPQNWNEHKPEMAARDPNNKTRFLIIGAGIAGMTAAATLRE